MGLWLQAAVVAVGGAAGAVGRLFVYKLAAAYLGTSFPHGTLIVNVVGSLALGFLVGLAAATPAFPRPIMLLVGTGFLGAFTTFSTFAVDTLQAGVTVGILNIVLNNAAAIGAAALGFYLGKTIAG